MNITNKEEIIILSNNIKKDIENMPRKILDISLIEDNKSDLTFFNIDEEESNETLKALKQSYVTTNYKEETILNLQSTLNGSSEDTSKELKIESYNRYNNSLDLANKNYITSAYELVEKALEINPKDVDILNLKGLLSLLKCDFSKSFESFYTAMCYSNNELSRRYVDVLSSDEFKVFLGRYNHSIRFINEEMNQESINILDNIIEEDENLIEPYVILSLLYGKMGDSVKKEMYLERLKDIDRDNPLFEETKEEVEETKEEDKEPKKSKKNLLAYALAAVVFIGIGVYSIYNKNRIDDLNSKLVEKEEKLDAADEKLDEVGEELDKKHEELKEKEEALDKVKEDEEKAKESVVKDEVALYEEALGYKGSNDYESAIESYKAVIELGKSQKYVSESIYQVALLNENLDNDEEAIKYYKKYINTYTKKAQYYDDAFYQLGMLYYENDQLKEAQDTFYGLRYEDPDSMYNNSKVEEILRER